MSGCAPNPLEAFFLNPVRMTLKSQFDSTAGRLELNPSTANVPAGAYERNEDIRSVIVPEGVETIGANAFAYCSNLNTLDLPESLKSIGKEAFFANFSLKQLEIPDEVQSIGDYSFQYARSLELIHIGDAVTSIGKRSFSNSSVLSELRLGNAVKTIGEKAFYRSPALADINIPDSVIHIGKDAFSGTRIKAVVLPKHFAENPPVDAFEPATLFSYRGDEQDIIGELTNQGWNAIESKGVWTDQADQLDFSDSTPAISWEISEDQRINTLQGNDLLIIKSKNSPAFTNFGTFRMHKGRDLLRINGHETTPSLKNEGVINMGKGRDQIDLLTGSMIGKGRIRLGPGKDIFRGFGAQQLVDGGKGHDQLRLPDGTYTLVQEGKRWHLHRDDLSMPIHRIEAVGGLDTPDESMLIISRIQQSGQLIVGGSTLSLT